MRASEIGAGALAAEATQPRGAMEVAEPCATGGSDGAACAGVGPCGATNERWRRVRRRGRAEPCAGGGAPRNRWRRQSRRSPTRTAEATEPPVAAEATEPCAVATSTQRSRGRPAEALVGDGAATAGAPRRSWRRRCRLAEAATDARSSLAAPGAVTSGRSLAR